ncbi:MAG: phytoene/squalene synthase family protein [Limnohabitans sp.]
MPENALCAAPAAPAMTPALMRLLRGVSRSFYLSIRLLPGPLRGPIALGYLLARATDTVADTSALPHSQRQGLLTQLMAAIETPAHADSALTSALHHFASQQSDPHERALMLALPDALPLLQTLSRADQASVRWVLGHITQGQALDLRRFHTSDAPSAHQHQHQHPHPHPHPQALASDAELDDYTWRVAGCVGEFWTELCDRHLPGFATLPTPEMRALGRQYGMGLQGLNILRDAGADLAQGRCYWPADRLATLGLSPARLAQAAHNGDAQTLAQLSPLYQAYLQKIQTQLAAGLRYSRALTSRRLRLASALPALIGVRTLALLAKTGPGALNQRIKMPRQEVRALLWRLLLRGASAQALAREFERLSAPHLQCENPTP